MLPAARRRFRKLLELLYVYKISDALRHEHIVVVQVSVYLCSQSRCVRLHFQLVGSVRIRVLLSCIGERRA